MFPELVAAYTEIIKAEPDVAMAGQHLLAFLEDAKRVAQTVKDAINAARSRAGLPPLA